MDKTAIAKTVQRYLSKGQIDLAIAEWERFVAEKKDGNVYNIIGDLYLKKNASKDAVESFKKAAEIFREDGFTLKAVAIYKKILNISPKEVDVILSVAELNREKGLTADAIESMIQAADIYSSEGKTEKAIETYQNALELAPHRISLKTKVIELYLKIGLYGEAVKLYMELAHHYLSMGDLEKAKGYFLNAVEIDRQNIPSLLGLSEIAERSGDIDGAIEYLKNALNIAPDNNEVLLRYSGFLIKKGMIDEAKDILIRMLELYPFNTEAKRLLGNIYLNENKTEEAWSELMPVIDGYLLEERWDDAMEILEKFKGMDSPDAMQRLARIYRGTGERDKAINLLKELARSYEESGRGEEAIQFYREIIKLNPYDKTARERLKDVEIKEEVPEIKIIKDAEREVKEEIGALSTEEFETRKAEADFYAQYGFNEHAIKLYKALLKFSPENREIIERLQALGQEVKPEEVTSVHEEPMIEEETEELPEQVTLTADKDSSLRDIILEFKRGIEREVDAEDAETHYNLGIGYKEMGLIDEAIREFLMASKDHSKTRQCMVMIALCHLDKGLYESAINVLNKVKSSMSPYDEGYLDMQYELASAHLKNKDYENALKLFTEIQGQDAQFRDVAKKIELVEELISSQKGKVRGKRDRVSYL